MPAILDTDASPNFTSMDGSGRTLAIDIGGTLIKTAVIDESGALQSEFLTTPTPKPSTPEAVIDVICHAVQSLPAFSQVSVGFPGVVGRTCIATAPNLGTERWRGFDLEQALTTRLGRSVRILNDAIVYGLGIARGPGRECVLTFGTGMGCALFCDGSAFFGLELGQHVAFDRSNYDQYIGHAAYLAVGIEEWNDRVARAIAAVHALTNSDRIYLGGGNSRRITFPLPEWASVVAPSSGIAGGARLWHRDMDRWFPPRKAAGRTRAAAR